MRADGPPRPARERAAGQFPAGASPAGTTAYVANFDDGTVTPVDLATGKARTPIKVGITPTAIAISPDGRTAYIANSGVGTVTPIDLAPATRGAPFKVGTMRQRLRSPRTA